ncbi:efflux RND transporter permease subunit [Thioalkalicoccus limnaeus]|uniref:Efflux RND transporter permease subunit n=1 Tax=Thioalkalicoccus limnaeus TaxID=120681 RepID=A0ABV4BBU5_9GAMM
MSQDDTLDQAPGGRPVRPDEDLGLAGRTAKFFIRSPLSLLFYVAMLLMGILGLMLTPRQEDPQISVPMINIMVQYPGATAQQVSNIAIQPLERIMGEIPGVKHVYSASERGQGIVTVQFEVGEKMGPSLVKVNDKIASNLDKIPPGVLPPLIRSKGIDDVPIVTLTLWSKDLDGDGQPDIDDGQLRLLAQDVLQALNEVRDTGSGFIVGGRREQVTVDVYPARLSSYQISLDQVAQTITTANAEMVAGGVEAGDTHFTVTTGSFLQGAEDIERLVVATRHGVPVYVRDVARVTRGPEDATQLVAYYTGPAAPPELGDVRGVPAVTIAIAKKELTNGVTVANAIIDRVEELRGTRIPHNVEVSITRNYGETANDKVSELITKLFIATGFVFLLVWVAFRALRPAFVVLLVIPVVLLMTIFVAWVAEFTIDRVSLFALIFSIGILVDDAIVVVENIYRRWLEQGRIDEDTAVDAVREVGNPTILATFTVIAALLPMGFVSGMMGPYMAPIPALGSVAMLISLFAAFVFTPYLAISGWLRPSMRYLETAEKREHKEAERLEALYRRILTPLIESRRKRRIFRLSLWGVFLFTLTFFYFTWVPVKMMPLDNKPEFSVVLDMPDGTALPVTANMAHRMAETLRAIPEVTAVQIYAGTARPFDFNGMVRHYYLRSLPWQGELQVQLTHKNDRKRTSHEIAVEAREMLNGVIQGSGARIAVVEMPPGPPVLQTVVAEIHGPTPEIRRQFARDMTNFFERAESTRDVDNFLRDPFSYWRFEVDTEKAVRRGISVDVINRNLAMALGGQSIGDVKHQAGHEPVEIVLQVPLAERSRVERLGDLPIQSMDGFTIPLRELGTFRQMAEEDVIYRKDLRAIEYVVADVGGKLAAPIYAMLQIQDLIEQTGYEAPDGVVPQSYWTGPPPSAQESAWEWTGEWTVTYETFRDMGAAFVVALLLIYILVVWEFGNFRIPLVIMAPIPLTLLGIIPAHALVFQMGLGGEFTATSMIGWIALAGIIVRNSILLVDFSIHELQKGVPVTEAVIRACKTRTRPILITALALVAGSSVIFTDPIFQGMAISLASGVLVSTLLTLIVIPLGCVAASKDMCAVAVATAPPGSVVPCGDTDQEQARDERKASAAQTRFSAFIGKVAEAMVLVLYAIRGLFLLLFDLVKGWLAKRQKGTDRPSPPPSDGGTGGSPGPGPSGGSSPAGSSSGDRTTTDSGAPQSSPTKVELPDDPSDVGPSHRADAALVAESPTVVPGGLDQRDRGGRDAIPPSRSANAGEPDPTARPAKTIAAKRALTKRPAKAAPGSRQASGPTDKATAKKGARRGIRLKADDESQGPDAG